MSKESSEWLNQNVLVGFTTKRGNAWHYKQSSQGDEPNHYPMSIPVEDVERRLFYWDARSYPVMIPVPTDITDPDIDGLDDAQGTPIKRVRLSEWQAIGRDDTHEVFRVFKSGYSIHQYREWLLTTVANLVDDDLAVASAGLLQNGGVAWVSIELPENIETPSGFSIRPQLLATTSHNGSLATTFKMTATAVVCDNTLSWGLSNNGQVFKARHSKHSGFKLQTAREALDIIHVGGVDVVAQIERLSQYHVSNLQFERILKKMIPMPTLETSNQAGLTRAGNKQDRMRDLWTADPRVRPWKNTALGVVQAFNTFNHHVKGTDKTRAERNMLSALNGKTATDDGAVMSLMADMGITGSDILVG
jgi:phage/plasmid-like protein (TIGR03299 family)